jgi:hypothetical protein
LLVVTFSEGFHGILHGNAAALQYDFLILFHAFIVIIISDSSGSKRFITRAAEVRLILRIVQSVSYNCSNTWNIFIVMAVILS